MGTSWKKTITCAICGVAFCGHVWHEAHKDADQVARPLARKPMIDTLLYARQAHGEEPDAPGWPLRMPRAIDVSTSTASVTGAPLIFGSTGIGTGLPHELVWKLGSSALVWGTTDQSSGSNVPASAAFTIATFPSGKPRSS